MTSCPPGPLGTHHRDLTGLAPKTCHANRGACAFSTLAMREASCHRIGYVRHRPGRWCGGDVQAHHRGGDRGTCPRRLPYEEKPGYTFPGVFGAIATADSPKYGAGREHLMDITIKSHENAPLNPKAQFKQTISDIIEARKTKAEKKGQPITGR